MSLADSSQTRLAYVGEVTPGTTPSSPSFQNLRFTSESLTYQKQTVTSDEIRPDRNVPDMADVGYSVSGDIGFELTYGTLDALLEGALQGAWATNALKNASTAKAFSFEKTFETGGTDRFFRYTGCQVSRLSLDIAARQKITGSMSLVGMGHSAVSAAMSGATYAPGNTKAVMNGSHDVGALSVSGVSPTPKLMRASLQIENNLRERPALGHRGPIGIGAGRFVVTGSLEAYFEDLALYNAFLDHSDVGLSLTVGSVTSEKYTIEVPKTKLSNGRITAGGNDQDVMAAFDWQGLLYTGGSPAFGASMRITRAVA